MMHIYIPTYRRVHRQKTLTELPRDWFERTTVVCVKDEAKQLARLYHCDVLVQPDSINSISKKRQWIVNQAKDDKICMLDDDLRICVRANGMKSGMEGGGYPNQDIFSITARLPERSQMFYELEQQLNKYAHAGISMRMGNQSRLPGWHENKRMCYVLAYQTRVVRRFARFDELAHREDMLVTLRLLQAGFPNSVSYLWAVDQTYNNAGGENAAGRNMEASNEDAYRLQKLFPDLVRTNVKKYRQSVPRVEVVVQWNKAFNESLF